MQNIIFLAIINVRYYYAFFVYHQNGFSSYVYFISIPNYMQLFLFVCCGSKSSCSVHKLRNFFGCINYNVNVLHVLVMKMFNLVR